MRNSATYWVNTIKTLTESLKTCQAQNKAVYKKAIHKANINLKAVRARAGIYC